MTNNTLYTPPSGPPQVSPPSHEIYHLMGEENIKRMIFDFYDKLSKSKISAMFPQGEDLKHAAEKSFFFFVGLLGGPPLYHEKIGNPMLRRRHFPFAIDEAARREWIRCFREVLENAEEKYSFPSEHLPGFITFLEEFSKWMVNRESCPGQPAK
ncbi:MAG: hypothetical protein COX62_02695 [Deltaproteobacteria bacterium CG_4_10_14_0_2_um_filter_43_8]|nr:MAG: hypothetical protein COV43_02590 [Deltaproteobacteria bacterium CG11_big_fil_rev_8_21_14_0_20_42_23]PJA21354.1 MAG: hypothetical protein COX62_02695 [Deltaproteobacteria bacterium CG_4_10_14_0_2_um_filter_43_8]PJC64814.1 MAG: hypothetical protein CO021_02385 [Deltaproteobacteria bacterium CG_4_9_14_0_2_um_filter_42_21]